MPGPYITQPRRRNAARFAGWWSRVTARIIDEIPPIVVAVVVVVQIGSVTRTRHTGTRPDGTPYDVSVPTLELPPSGFALIFGFMFIWFFYNVVYRQGRTGQTVGKTMLGIALYRTGTVEPIGAGLSFVRQIVHIVDGFVCNLGYLWPLWDDQKRTFTDMIMGTRVYHASTPSWVVDP